MFFRAKVGYSSGLEQYFKYVRVRVVWLQPIRMNHSFTRPIYIV